MSTQFDVEQPTRGWRVLAPFRFREYRLLIGALSISIFAEGMWAVVMAMQVIALDDDPATLSLVATCLGTGLVAFVLVGGIAADRINQRTIIIAVEAVDVAVVLTVAVLGSLGVLRIWHMAVAAGALGVAAAFFFPAYSAFAVAALFTVGLVLLVATRPAKTTALQNVSERPHALRDIRAGFRFMVRTPWLLWTLLFASVFVLVVLGPIEVLLPFIARDRFADGARMYGFILAAFGVGSAIGALAVSSGRLPRRYLTVMMVMWGAGSLPLVIVGATSSFPVMALATFVVGVTDGAACVIWGTLLQRRVPREMLGRVSSLDFFVSLVFLPVSFAIAGPLSKVVSIETIFLAAGVVPVLLAAVAMVAARMPRDEVAHPLA